MSVTGDVHIGEIGFCPGADVTLRRNDPAIPVAEAEALARRIAAIPIEKRPEFEPALWAFYRQEIEDGLGNFDTTEEQFAFERDMDSRGTFEGCRPATTPSEVWPLIRLTLMIVRRNGDRLEAQLGGASAWDGEHGCTFLFDEEAQLTGVRGW